MWPSWRDDPQKVSGAATKVDSLRKLGLLLLLSSTSSVRGGSKLPEHQRAEAAACWDIRVCCYPLWSWRVTAHVRARVAWSHTEPLRGHVHVQWGWVFVPRAAALMFSSFSSSAFCRPRSCHLLLRCPPVCVADISGSRRTKPTHCCSVTPLLGKRWVGLMLLLFRPPPPPHALKQTQWGLHLTRKPHCGYILAGDKCNSNSQVGSILGVLETINKPWHETKSAWCFHGNTNTVQWHLNRGQSLLASLMFSFQDTMEKVKRGYGLIFSTRFFFSRNLAVYQRSILGLTVICQRRKAHQERGIHSLLSSRLFHIRFEPHLSPQIPDAPSGFVSLNGEADWLPLKQDDTVGVESLSSPFVMMQRPLPPVTANTERLLPSQ